MRVRLQAIMVLALLGVRAAADSAAGGLPASSQLQGNSGEARQVADRLLASFRAKWLPQSHGIEAGQGMNSEDNVQHAPEPAVDWRDVGVVRGALLQLGMDVVRGWQRCMHCAAHGQVHMHATGCCTSCMHATAGPRL